MRLIQLKTVRISKKPGGRGISTNLIDDFSWCVKIRIVGSFYDAVWFTSFTECCEYLHDNYNGFKAFKLN